jgi:hypothetical protein
MSAAQRSLQTQQYARVHGWMLGRHAYHPTTDLPCSVIPSVARWIHSQLRYTILPTLAHLYDFRQSELEVCDLFVVRYTTGTGSSIRDQSKLPAHRDGNLLSFNILLSDPNIDFKGGGTHFFSSLSSKNTSSYKASSSLQQSHQQRQHCKPYQGSTVQPEQGDITIHCGKLLHEGAQISQGTRYIIVGFIDVTSDKLDDVYLNSDAPNQSKQGIDIDYECITRAYKQQSS